MLPQAQGNAHPSLCTHGVRGKDPATGVCIPCRDEQVFCRDCLKAVTHGDWLRYGRRCEPCHDAHQRRLDIAMAFSAERRFWTARDNADRAIAAELRAQDRGGA